MTLQKLIEKEHGYNLEKDGEVVSIFQPCTTYQYIRLNRVRIQSDEGFSAIHGITYLPVGNADVTYAEDSDKSYDYHPPRTMFSQVSISARENVQEQIEATGMGLGIIDLNKGITDISSHLSIELASQSYEEIYELVKTRQLTSLTFTLLFKDPKEPLKEGEEEIFTAEYEPLYQEYRSLGSLDEGKFLIRRPEVYMVESMGWARGEVERVGFATEPLKLQEENWGFWGMSSDGYDDESNSFEALLEKENKAITQWASFSNFESIVIALLSLITLGLLVIRFII